MSEQISQDMQDDYGRLGPIVDGVEKAVKLATETKKSVEEKVDEIATKTQRANEDLESKVNKSVESLAEQVQRLAKGSKILGRALNIVPGDDQLKSLIPDHLKPRMREFEALGKRSFSPDSDLATSATSFALANEWTLCTWKANLRKYAAKAGELMAEAEKYRAALEEKAHGSEWESVTRAALQEDTTTEGGYLVPTIVANEIDRKILDAADIFPRCRQVALTKKTTNFPNEATAVTVNWVEEEGSLTQGEPVFGQTQLIAEKLAGRATMSYEILQDANPGLLPYLMGVFAEKMAGELDYQAVLGDGSGPQLTGIINGSGINAITSGTAAGRTLTWDLLVQTFVKGSEKSTRMDSVWVCSPNGYGALLRLVDDQSRPIVQMDVQGAPAGAILGRPILVSARLGGNLTLDDVTNTATKIVFGPLNKVLFGTRLGMSWDVTDQVNWAKYQVDARLIGRYGCNVSIPSAFTYLGQIAY